MDFQELIERYLDGRMDAEEALLFEASLKADKNLQEALSLEISARELIKTAGREDLKQRLEQFEQDRNNSKVKSLKISFRILAVAASVVFILLAGNWMFKNQTEKRTRGDLFAAYFEPYRGPVQIRGEVEDQHSPWETAKVRYNNKNYEGAIERINLAIQNQEAPEYLLHFYLGMSLLSKEDPDFNGAIEAFDQVLGVISSYQQQASWYKALALIKLNEKDMAIEVLEDLKAKNDFKKEKIDKVIEALQ